MTTRKLLIGLALAGLLVGGLGAMPASAQLRSVTVTLADGREYTVVVTVPSGTPADQVSVPSVGEPVVSVSSGPAPPGSGGGSSPSGPSGPSGSSGSSGPAGPSPSGSGSNGGGPPVGASPATGPPRVIAGQEQAQRTTGGRRGTAKAKPQGPSSAAQTVASLRSGAGAGRTPSGLPTAGNPTFSLALPGASPIGVPDFFIEKFRVPLFLLPMYQAAGTEYGVPWQVLAAINEIETDYGRDLSVSSAGAEGWMQFLPGTWKTYGVDANQDGTKDPYDPADAIFAAARYLRAAGADKNLRGAIFAYNHANWYVDSVLLRAKLIGGLPDSLLGSLTGLTQGHFPVHARSRYADDAAELQATAARSTGAKKAQAVKALADSGQGVNIFAAPNSPAVAVQDGTITKIGSSPKLGNFIVLRDTYGNTYTYANLKSVATSYPVPKPRPATPSPGKPASARSATGPGADPKPAQAASAGHQPATANPVSGGGLAALGAAAGAAATGGAAPAPAAASAPAAPSAPATSGDGSDPSLSESVQVHKERLYANPNRPAAYRSGGHSQLDSLARDLPSSTTVADYFTQVYGLDRSQVELKPLRAGAKVIAGTIIGHLGNTTPGMGAHVLFQLRPAGSKSPQVDPKPVLDGWKLLEATSIYRAAGKNPFLGPDAKNPTIGQIFLMSKEALQERVLQDPNVTIYPCGRRDVEAGAIDRRVLATLEFLVASGMKPNVSTLKCAATPGSPASGAGPPTSVAVPDQATGNGVDIDAINNIPISGHQGAGSIADMTIRRLLTLQGIMKPRQIVSLMTYPGTDNTLALPDHANRIHVGFLPQYSTDPKLRAQIDAALKPQQWIKLIDRLRQIPNPVVSPAPSAAAIPAQAAGSNGNG